VLAVFVGVRKEALQGLEPLLAVGGELERDALPGRRVESHEGVERSASRRDVMLLDPADDSASPVENFPLRRPMAEPIRARR
jgi:hypothetical protein